MTHPYLRAVLAGLLGGLAACGESEVSDLSYAEVRQAATSGDEASFRKVFSALRGQRVGWRGRVVEVAREHGDEFAEINLLLVDLDGEQGGTTDPDASFRISAATAEEMFPGREVVLIGRLEDYDWGAQGPLLRLEGQRVE